MKSKARKAIHTAEKALHKKFKKGPHFQVASGIRNNDEMEGVFTGTHYGYARVGGHPDHQTLEKWITEFEGAAVTRVRADGMGAVSMMAITAAERRGKKIIVILPTYGGTYYLAKYHTSSPVSDITFDFLFANDPFLPEKLYHAIDEDTGGILFEVSGNPTLTFPDVSAIIYVARNHPKARPLVMVDDTFLFGIVKPFDWGADIVVSSGTKYLVGESAWTLGFACVSPELYNSDPDFWIRAVDWTIIHGGTLGPFEAHITGHYATADVTKRIMAHSKNAMQIAEFLERHPNVRRVIYPGLASYPYKKNFHEYAHMIDGNWYYGGMIAFYVDTDSYEETEKFLCDLNNSTHFENKASLGCPTDSIETPYGLSHKNMNDDDKVLAEITPNVCRLSVGRVDEENNPLDPEKTINALDRALYAIKK